MFQRRQRRPAEFVALVFKRHLASDGGPVEQLRKFLEKLAHVLDVVEADAQLQRFVVKILVLDVVEADAKLQKFVVKMLVLDVVEADAQLQSFVVK